MPGSRELEECQEPFRDDVGVGGEQVVRQNLPVRESQQRQAIARKEAQLRCQPLELTRGVADDDVKPLVASRCIGERQRGRAAVELVPADLATRGSGDGGVEE